MREVSTNKVPKELQSWLIPCLYPAYTLYLEILVTALFMSVEIGNFQVTPINKSFNVKKLVRKAEVQQYYSLNNNRASSYVRGG